MKAGERFGVERHPPTRSPLCSCDKRELTQRQRWPRGQLVVKINLYFNFELYNCLDLFSAPIGLRTCSNLICNASVQFQMKPKKAAVDRVFQKKQNLVFSCCRLAEFEDSLEMCKDLWRTCTTIVLLMKPFVWWHSSWPCHRGLLKLSYSHDDFYRKKKTIIKDLNFLLVEIVCASRFMTLNNRRLY